MYIKRLLSTLAILILILAFSQCRKDRIVDYDLPSTPIGTPYSLEIPIGFPSPYIPNDNPLTEEAIKLGRHLFFEKRLSADNTMSCSSCHLQLAAFTDGKILSEGIRGLKTRRHAMTIFNLAWQEHFFWDGRAMSLEEQALMPIEDEFELDNELDTVVARLSKDPLYQKLFTDAFGDKTVTPKRIGKAIAQFERIIVSANSEFDSVVRLKTKAEFRDLGARRGFDMFSSETGDCFHCHGHLETAFQFGAFGRDIQFLNNGVLSTAEQMFDKGREEVTGNLADRSHFKVPSVRNAEFSLPFMHNGSITDLDSLIQFYEKGIHITPNIDPNINKPNGLGRKNWSLGQKDDLKKFMKSLTDYKFLTDTNYASPF